MGANKGAGKGCKSGSHTTNANVNGGGNGAHEKQQCQFIIGIEEEPRSLRCVKFGVVKRIIGVGGENMKRIAGDTCANLRLRGRGSNFKEGPENKESTDDLMLCISMRSPDQVGFEAAKNQVSELLNRIYKDYEAFCRKAGKGPPALGIQIHEGYREGSR